MDAGLDDLGDYVKDWDVATIITKQVLTDHRPFSIVNGVPHKDYVMCFKSFFLICDYQCAHYEIFCYFVVWVVRGDIVSSYRQPSS